MSKESDEILNRLIARIPELEWKVRDIGTFISSQNIPKGLFRIAEPSGASCIAEIKADIYRLSQQNDERSAIYMAERLRQKVNVLVVLCQVYHRKNKPENKFGFCVNMLSTRQQWINDLEAEINLLVEQQQAIKNTLEQLKFHHPKSNIILNVKLDLGEVERRLTLAREALNLRVS